jgi:hypothetical protein
MEASVPVLERRSTLLLIVLLSFLFPAIASSTTLPSVTTAPVSSIEIHTAISGGNVTGSGASAVTAHGVVWATHAAPTTADSKTKDGSGAGKFVSALSGLARGTVYHVRAYATNAAGTAYGNELTFTTQKVTPMLRTRAVSSIAATTAASGGQITDDGGAKILARGVVWSTRFNPTTADAKTIDGGSDYYNFTSALTKLASGGEYHVRAYATNSIGTGYGADLLFTTQTPAGVPTVTTAAASALGQTSATVGGTVSSAGSKAVAARGVVWAADHMPTLADSKKTVSGTTGAFTVSLTGLKAKTSYYVRAYATNANGTGYGAAVLVPTLNPYGLPAAVAPLISNRWLDYTWPYNAYYPKLNGVVGQATCGPTALAKLLGYWKSSNWQGSINQTDEAGYTWKINLATTKIDFSKVYDELSSTATQAQYDQTAKIFLAAGAVGNLNGIGGGNPFKSLFAAFQYNFKLSPAFHMEHDWEYTAGDWKHLVEWELAHGRPLMVAGRTPESSDPWQGGSSDGHWWTVDGYDDQDQIHATYNFVDYSGAPIAGYFPIASMGPVTFDAGQWDGYTRDHFVGFGFEPALASTAVPVVETAPVSNLTSTTARLAGSVVGQGNVSLTQRGFHIVPATGAAFDVYAAGGEGHFVKTLTGLTPSTAYTVEAFGSTGSKYYYGEKQQFTALASGVTPDEVMPLIDTEWSINTWPYNAGLPALSSGPGGHFYNESGATNLARLLAYWRSPAKGTGVYGVSMNWNGTAVNLQRDLATLHLDYTRMPNALSSSSSAADYAQVAALVAAAESFGFGSYPSGAGNLRSADPDSSVVSNLVSAWGLDPGLKMVKQESVTASAWAQMLKAEIAAGRPVLVLGRTAASAAPGASGSVSPGWFLVDGYNAQGEFFVDTSLSEQASDPPGWFPANALGSADPYAPGYTAYNRALVGFKPKK